MALTAVHGNAALALSSTQFFKGVNDDDGDEVQCGYEFSKFTVMGHRGFGMNMLQSSVPRMKSFKENSILSFNAAAKLPIDFIEFDVQVVKPLFRKTKDEKIFEWKVDNDDPLCTLQEAFEKVEHSIGFNIELKFDDQVVYTEDELTRVLQAIFHVVNEYAKNRPILFSSFQPDAALLIRKLQTTYPVLFLTNGGSEIYKDIRRNSLDEAIKACLTGGLQGIVSEVRALFRNPGAETRIKESKLSLLTYGQLNNVPEVVYMQHLMGVDGVIVDLVEEVTEAISYDWIKPAEDREEDSFLGEEGQMQVKTKPGFMQQQLSLLQKLPPELLHT